MKSVELPTSAYGLVLGKSSLNVDAGGCPANSIKALNFPILDVGGE
jgi:hypothetical protein